MEKVSGYTSFDPTLPQPVAFFSWKHHLGYILNEIKQLRGSLAPDQISGICEGIGGSVLDLYIGYLEPLTIANEVIFVLSKLGVLLIPDYTLWIDNDGECYRMLTLPDGSSWTLRMGKDPGRYLHIHPSRYSANTIRVKPSTLKTAIATMLLHPILTDPPTVEQINHARSLIPNLSPVREIKGKSSIFNLLKYMYR